MVLLHRASRLLGQAVTSWVRLNTALKVAEGAGAGEWEKRAREDGMVNSTNGELALTCTSSWKYSCWCCRHHSRLRWVRASNKSPSDFLWVLCTRAYCDWSNCSDEHRVGSFMRGWRLDLMLPDDGDGDWEALLTKRDRGGISTKDSRICTAVYLTTSSQSNFYSSPSPYSHGILKCCAWSIFNYCLFVVLLCCF